MTTISHCNSLMALEKLNGLELPAAADMHVHLREKEIMELVTYESTNDATDVTAKLIAA